MLLLIVGLAGFGAGSFGGSFSNVAEVGEEKVSVQTYVRALNNQLSQISQQTGQQFTFDQARILGVDRQVLEQVLAVAALDGEARKAGISVGDDRVQTQLLATQAFQGVDGQFDANSYNFALTQARLDPAEYDEILRKENARELLQSSVMGSVATSDQYALAVLSYLREMRDFRWAAVTKDHLTTPTRTPTSDEATTYYDAHPDDFTVPETKTISYVYLLPDMVSDQVTVDEEQLQQQYEDRADDYNVPERRLVERLVYASQAEAEEAAASLKAGVKTFEQLVEDRGLTLSDVDLGDMRIEALTPDAATGVFGMAEPGVSGPLTSAFGPALFRVNGILDAQMTTFEQAREELIAEISAEAARRLVSSMSNQIDDLLASGATLEEVAADTDMVLGTVDYSAGSDEGLLAYNIFRQDAAVVTQNDFPSLNTLSDGGIFALRLDQTTPPTLQPLAEVQAEVASGWQAQETLSRLSDLAATMSGLIESGMEFQQVGLEFSDAVGLFRNGFVEGISPGMVTKVFALENNGIARDSGEDAVYIARLSSVVAFDPTHQDSLPLIASVTQQRNDQLQQDFIERFVVAIQNEVGVTIDQSALNAVQTSVGAPVGHGG